MYSRWKSYLLYASLIIVGGGLIFGLTQAILAGYSASWTGFGDFTKPNGEFVRGKNLWDWLELLIIPLFLTGGAIALNFSEKNRERKLAEDRAKLEREIAMDRQQEAALQAYLDRMAELLLEKKFLTTEDKEVRDVARIRTLTVLRGLDIKRKGIVLNFLYEAKLIDRGKPIIELQGADLSGTKLINTILANTDLIGVDLTEADLHGSHFTNANLGGAILTRADLHNAILTIASLVNVNLQNANLSGAIFDRTNLKNTDLRGAVLQGAILNDTSLKDANLEGATMPDGTKHD